MARPPRRPARRGGDERRTRGKGSEGQPTPRKGRPTRSAKEERAPKRWGGVARGAVRRLDEPVEGSAAAAWRAAAEATRRGRRTPDRAARGEWEPERLEQVPEGTTAGPAGATDRPRVGARRGGRRKVLSEQVGEELRRTAGSQVQRLEQRVAHAARAFDAERYRDAARDLRALAAEAPGAPAVRELYGLSLYRLGRWRAAAKELEAFRELTGSVDQHPVLADSYRALGRHRKVATLWEELREASPSAALVAEGRIVAAGSLADRGDLGGAIRLLERGRLEAKRPKLHHLRLWYALGDLAERAGDVPRARELFTRVAAADRDFADVAERLDGLG